MTTAGSGRQLLWLQVHSRERMVVLNLKDGQQLYFSPQDIDGFVPSIGRIVPESRA